MSEVQSVVLRRNRRGCTSEELSSWADQDIAEMDSTLAVQQWIQQRLRAKPTDVKYVLELPSGQDAVVWQFEQLRQICLELSDLITRLLGTCTHESCPRLNATAEWEFLCAAHRQPQECSAIDYSIHTLEAAIATLNNKALFPSRVNITEAMATGVFQATARRLYRIFAHTYFHHKSVFDSFENEHALCERFTVLCRRYSLMSEDLFLIPASAFVSE